MMQTTSMTLIEVAHRYGVSVRALRYYEELGLVAPDKIGKTRLYDDVDILRLQVIIKAKRMRFSIKEIKEHFSDQQSCYVDDIVSPKHAYTIGKRLEEMEAQRDAIEIAIAELKEALLAKL